MSHICSYPNCDCTISWQGESPVPETVCPRDWRGSMIKPNELEFLKRLMQWTGAATRFELGKAMDDKETHVRQACRKNGWVVYTRPYWRITDAGKRMLTIKEPDATDR